VEFLRHNLNRVLIDERCDTPIECHTIAREISFDSLTLTRCDPPLMKHEIRDGCLSP
jgi:hypothetical protein